jgi:hypothetical protein
MEDSGVIYRIADNEIVGITITDFKARIGGRSAR